MFVGGAPPCGGQKALGRRWWVTSPSGFSGLAGLFGGPRFAALHACYSFPAHCISLPYIVVYENTVRTTTAPRVREHSSAHVSSIQIYTRPLGRAPGSAGPAVAGIHRPTISLLAPSVASLARRRVRELQLHAGTTQTNAVLTFSAPSFARATRTPDVANHILTT